MGAFEENLDLINEIVQVLRAETAHETVTPRDLSALLRVNPERLIAVFDVLGLVPRDWSAPEDYAVEDILEACTRYEVSARFNRR